MNYKSPLCFFVIICCLGCGNTSTDAPSIEQVFGEYYKILNTTDDKEVLQTKHLDIEDILHELKSSESPHLSDFAYLNKLFKAKIETRELHNAKLSFKYLALSFLMEIQDALIKKYQIAQKETGAPGTCKEGEGQKYAIHKTLPGFVLKEKIKQFLKSEVLAKLAPGGSGEVQLAFRGKGDVQTTVSLQMSKDKFRLIDHNLGVLAFDNQEDLLQAFADYRSGFYVNNLNPELMIVGKLCP